MFNFQGETTESTLAKLKAFQADVPKVACEALREVTGFAKDATIQFKDNKIKSASRELLETIRKQQERCKDTTLGSETMPITKLPATPGQATYFALKIGPARREKIQEYARSIFDAVSIELADLGKRAKVSDTQAKLDALWAEVVKELDRMEAEDKKPDGSEYKDTADANAYIEAFLQGLAAKLREELEAALKTQAGSLGPSPITEFEVTQALVNEAIGKGKTELIAAAQQYKTLILPTPFELMLNGAINGFVADMQMKLGKKFSDQGVWLQLVDSLLASRKKNMLDTMQAFIDSGISQTTDDTDDSAVGESVGWPKMDQIQLCAYGKCDVAREGGQRKYLVKVIQPGMSLNNYFYDANMLREAAPLLENIPVQAYGFGQGDFFGHLGVEEAELQPNGFFLNRVGLLQQPQFLDDGPQGPGQYATLVVDEHACKWACPVLDTAVQEGNNGVGLSIFAEIDGDYAYDPKSDQMYINVKKIKNYRSVDLASKPAAGGAVVALASENQGHAHMEEIKAMIRSMPKDKLLKMRFAKEQNETDWLWEDLPNHPKFRDIMACAGVPAGTDPWSIMESIGQYPALAAAYNSLFQMAKTPGFGMYDALHYLSLEVCNGPGRATKYAPGFAQQALTNDPQREALKSRGMEMKSAVMSLSTPEILALKGCGGCGKKMIANASQTKRLAMEAVKKLPWSQLLKLRPDLARAQDEASSDAAPAEVSDTAGVPEAAKDRDTLKAAMAQVLGLSEEDPLLDAIVDAVLGILAEEVGDNTEEVAQVSDAVDETQEAVKIVSDRVSALEKDRSLAECEVVLEDTLKRARLPRTSDRIIRQKFAGRVFQKRALEAAVAEHQQVVNGLISETTSTVEMLGRGGYSFESAPVLRETPEEKQVINLLGTLAGRRS